MVNKDDYNRWNVDEGSVVKCTRPWQMETSCSQCNQTSERRWLKRRQDKTNLLRRTFAWGCVRTARERTTCWSGG